MMRQTKAQLQQTIESQGQELRRVRGEADDVLRTMLAHAERIRVLTSERDNAYARLTAALTRPWWRFWA